MIDNRLDNNRLVPNSNRTVDGTQVGDKYGVSDAYNTLQEEINEYERMTAPDINEIYNNYSTSGKPILNILKEYYKPPKPRLTPEQERRVRTSSAIADSLALLAEMYSLGIGGDVRLRQGKTNSQLMGEALERERERMEREEKIYNQLMTQGAIKDFSNYLQNAKGEYERTLQNKRDRVGRKEKDYLGKLNRQNAREDAEWQLEKKRKEALWKLDNIDRPLERERYRRQMALQNARRSGGGGRTSYDQNGNLIITVGSKMGQNLNDKRVYQNQLGEWVMSDVYRPDEVDYNFNKALQLWKSGSTEGEAFKRRYPHLSMYKATIDGGGSLDSYASGKTSIDPSEKAEWVWAYVDYIYNGGDAVNNGGGGYETWSYRLPILGLPEQQQQVEVPMAPPHREEGTESDNRFATANSWDW